MDSDRVNAVAFSMGVKRSKILLPWEKAPLKGIFGFKEPLIPPAEWVPDPTSAAGTIEPERTVSKGHLMGKHSWTTRTTVIPWPVFEEARLSKVLELWRVVILDSYMYTALGRQIHDLMSQAEVDEEALKEHKGCIVWEVHFDPQVQGGVYYNFWKVEEVSLLAR